MGKPATQAQLPSSLTIAVAAVLLVVLAAALALWSCGNNKLEQEPQPFYKQANFTQQGQFYYYTQDGITANKTGIDVSDHQGWIDWNAVAASGIQFAYIRIGYRGSTEGGLYADDYYEYNLNAAKDAGLARGIYFFSQATTAEEAREEAAFVLDLLDGMQLEYPVVFDSEMSAEGIQSRVAGLGIEESSTIAQTFCEIVEAGGYDAMIYGNGYDLARLSDNVLTRWPIWYAEYGALPSYANEFALWQYSAEGTIDGIDTPVDLNLDLRTIAQQQATSR